MSDPDAPSDRRERSRRPVGATPVRSRPLVIAHRGASGRRPEHSVAAYQLAFKSGADAVEPDVVATRDGVLVVRHENEISGTTDVSEHPEFRDRRTTKLIDGEEVTGWFTEDFTWPELLSLRCRERLPGIRPSSAAFDDRFPLLRLADVVSLAGGANASSGAPLRLVVELKHATYFASIGLPLPELVRNEFELAGLAPDEAWVTFESFEKTCLTQLEGEGLRGRRVYLAQRTGAAFDEVAARGGAAITYAEELSASGLDTLSRRGSTGERGGGAARLDGVSVDKALLVDDPIQGRSLVETSHRLGLEVLCWTMRPENSFLSPRYRRGAPTGCGEWAAELICAFETGVDALFVDYPEEAIRVRDRWHSAPGAASSPWENGGDGPTLPPG